MSRSSQQDKNFTVRNFGPLKWMAPEALRMEYSKATDIWSFGVTMVEIWTRNDPYPNEPNFEVAVQVRDGKKFPELPTEAPKDIKALMLRCWSFYPDTRPKAPELQNALDKIYFQTCRPELSGQT